MRAQALTAIAGALLLTGAVRSVHADCTSIQTASIALRDDPSAPALPLFDGTLNGRHAVLAFDTGAFATLLTADAATRLGLTLSDTAIPASGAGGGTVLRTARLADAVIGPAHLQQHVLPVLPRGAALPFDALAGADLIFQSDVELDFAHREARFFTSSGCEHASRAYWGAAYTLPFRFASDSDRRPRVQVRLNGILLEALFDTGSPHTLLSATGAQKLGLHPDSAGVRPAAPVSGVGGQTSPAWEAQASLAIGEERLARWPVRLTGAPSADALPAELVLGMDFLRARRMLFAPAQGQVAISSPTK